MNESYKTILNVMLQNEEYFQEDTTIDIQIKHKKGIINSIDDLIVDDIGIEVICLKLVHNISLINTFYIHYAKSHNCNVENYRFLNDSKYYLKLNVSPDTVDIVRRKGFGLFTYNVDDMSATLGQFSNAIKEYLITEKGNNFSELQLVIDFIDEIKLGLEPNLAMSLFIEKNSKLYDKYR